MSGDPRLLNQSANQSGTNHPLATRMAVIAFVSYNMTIACVYGTYSLLIVPLEGKMGVNRDLSSFGLPLALLGISLTAPVVGVLASKISIRLILMAGVLMQAAGFAIAGAAGSIYLFLAAYGLLIGPGACIAGTMMPSMLVTRWYNLNRGRTLGIINVPFLMIGFPPLVAVVLRDHGLSATYFMLAALMVLVLPFLFFIVDYPPSAIDPTGENVAAETAVDPGMSVGELLRTGSFWALTLAFAVVMGSATVLSAHLVPMVMLWGMNATTAAELLVGGSIGGLAGSIAFGWIADRIGGALTVAILCFNGAILWAALLLQPPFLAAVILVALLGAHGASVVAAFGMALSQRFGQASFGRAFGIATLASLPFLVLSGPVTAHIYVLTGSYAGGVIVVASVLMVGAISALIGRRTAPVPAAA